MARAGSLVLLALLTVACGQPFWTPRPRAAHLSSEDPRRAYLGQWEIEFTLDSLIDPVASPVAKWRWSTRGDGPERIMGSLTVKDSLTGREGRFLRSNLDIDFVPLLGRSMSCFRSGPGALDVSEDRGQTVLWFTPGAFDCGFSGRGELRSDSVVGAWSESSIAGPIATGHFQMRRS